MKNTLDVDKILDIPGIEDHLDKQFDLVFYEKGDNYQFYNCKISEKKYIHIHLASEESLIHGQDLLAEIISQPKIDFLEYGIGPEDGKCKDSYWFRPLVDKINKVYE